VLKDGTASHGDAAPRPLRDVLGGEDLTETGKIKPGKTAKAFSQASYGAFFAEVGVHAFTGEVRVRRMTGVFGFGRVLNAKTARSQCLGGMVWGIGSALTEELAFDTRDGHLVNHDLAEYHVPVHADVPAIEVILLEERDAAASPLQAKGVGELGICGAAGAIANAVYNACGVRVRSFPSRSTRSCPRCPIRLPKRFERTPFDVAAPVRYTPDLEQPQADEAETDASLEKSFDHILETTAKDYGRPVRAVHAKAHGLFEGTLTVDAHLPPELAQGLFAQAGRYAAALRVSTNPGDILDDNVVLPRGMALKVEGVSGDFLPEAEGGAQDFLFVNSPVFATASASQFAGKLKLLAATTDRAPGAKVALSTVLGFINSALGKVGLESGACRDGRSAASPSAGRNLFLDHPVPLWRARRQVPPAPTVSGADRAHRPGDRHQRAPRWPARNPARGCRKPDRRMGVRGAIAAQHGQAAGRRRERRMARGRFAVRAGRHAAHRAAG
jgi:hypothetical protein